MRIRKRTPARAASPGLSPALSPLPPVQQSKDLPREDEDNEAAAAAAEEEKRVILVAAARGREDGRVVVVQAAASKNTCTRDTSPLLSETDEPKPAQEDDARCSRNDGKRWRCKNSAAPGFLFCDRHVKWQSARQRQPPRRASNKKPRNKDVGEPVVRVPTEQQQEEEADDKEDTDDDDDGSYSYFHQGGRPGAADLG